MTAEEESQCGWGAVFGHAVQDTCEVYIDIGAVC